MRSRRCHTPSLPFFQAEASLVWEALRDPAGVRAYRDLSQAADELAAMAGAME